MNFLGHLYLSGEDEQLLIGNFLADAVKGAQFKNFPLSVQKGILMHREIDRFTDNHPVVRKSKIRVQHVCGKYAGVVIDVFYDHFLAKNWSRYHPVSLHEFADHAYGIVEKNSHLLPDKTRFMFHYMQKHNWLVGYSHTEGIARTLKGLSQRTRFPSGMENAHPDLLNNYDEFRQEFEAFFQDARSFFSIYLRNNEGLNGA